MSNTSRYLAAASLLPLTCAAQPQETPSAVIIEYRLPGQSAEQIEASLVNILEKRLAALPEMQHMDSTASDGKARIEIRFARNAGAKDLLAVRAEVDRFDSVSGLAPATLVDFGKPYGKLAVLPLIGSQDGK